MTANLCPLEDGEEAHGLTPKPVSLPSPPHCSAPQPGVPQPGHTGISSPLLCPLPLPRLFPTTVPIPGVGHPGAAVPFIPGP